MVIYLAQFGLNSLLICKNCICLSESQKIILQSIQSKATTRLGFVKFRRKKQTTVLAALCTLIKSPNTEISEISYCPRESRVFGGKIETNNGKHFRELEDPCTGTSYNVFDLKLNNSI